MYGKHFNNKKIFTFITLFFVALTFIQACNISKVEPEKKEKPFIYQMEIKGAITPATLEQLENGVSQAEKDNAKALLISLDTPGGLASSMDDMIRSILNSKVPVITYVSPAGSTCGSAGVYIMYASHIAAMAPATNIGSATPVNIGGGTPAGDPKNEQAKDKTSDTIPTSAGADDSINLKRKIMHHAVAQIRSLADYRKRNVKFAEESVTRAANITSYEALHSNVIDVLAVDRNDLLKQIEGKRVRMSSSELTLNLSDADVRVLKNDFRSRFLAILSNPNVAYIFMVIGMLGVLGEIQYPGSIFPGTVGAISLLLALYSMQTLPVNYAGFLLIILGFILFILEIKIISYGALTIGGIISLILGSLMLLKSGNQVETLSVTLVIVTSITIGVGVVWILYKTANTLKKPPIMGDITLPDENAKCVDRIDKNSGRIFFHGEYWNARSIDDDIESGEIVQIVKRDGLTIYVKRKD